VERPFARRRDGVQQFNLFPWLTVAQNVPSGLEVAGIKPPKKPAPRGALRASRRLMAFADHYPHELSGGSAARRHRPRLALDPEVLLAWTSRSARSTPTRASARRRDFSTTRPATAKVPRVAGSRPWQDAQQGGLAAAARADDRDELAARTSKRTSRSTSRSPLPRSPAKDLAISWTCSIACGPPLLVSGF